MKPHDGINSPSGVSRMAGSISNERCVEGERRD
jgi:hypothetical protein